MNLEEQIKLHKQLSKKIDELEEQKRILSSAIMKQMQGKTLQIPGFLVRKYSRISVKMSIEEARLHNAVKFEEMIDKDKIKMLYNNGQPINGVDEVQYIQVTEQPFWEASPVKKDFKNGNEL